MTLLAGEDGCSNAMSWVQLVEDKTILQQLWGKELVVTTGLGFQSQKKLKEFIEQLVKYHSVGLVINTGKYVFDIDQEIIDFCNELSNEGPVIILDDIAYIDYSYNLERSRDYMNAFNRMNDQVMIVVAFSCSKTLTSYGLRCGGAVILARNQEDVRALEILMEKHARASWSNIPNAAMENFVKVTTEHKDDFYEEKGKYVDLLRQRCEVFKKEAECH